MLPTINGMARRGADQTLRFVLATILACSALSLPGGRAAAQERLLGIDVSAWQRNLPQTTWNNLHNVNERDFVFIRSSRGGGSSGFYNQSDPSNSSDRNTLAQRYDDPYFVQNITRATNAGMFAGAYHFARPDIVANTHNADGIAKQTGHPKDSYTPIYGPWDDASNPTHPWSFWQYASTARLSGYNSGNSNIDVNVAQGGIDSCAVDRRSGWLRHVPSACLGSAE